METVDPTKFDLRKLHRAVEQDVDVLRDIWERIKDIRAEDDAKLNELKRCFVGTCGERRF